MKLKKILNILAAAALATVVAMPTVFASTDNPLTGDEQGKYIGIVIAVAAVALVVIIVSTAMSSKKGKK